MNRVRILATGVDTIHASAPGVLIPGLREELAQLRTSAGNDGLPLEVGDNPEGFVLQPHGWRRYPIWLRSARIEVMLGACDPFPPVFVQWHSPFIHAYGLNVAVQSVEAWLDGALMEARADLRVARLDLYCDFQGWQPEASDLDRFTCRAVRRRLFETHREAHLSGRRFSGFTFGKGDVVARIYDKSLEASVRGQAWQSEVWARRDPNMPVWRVEFQFRRRALRRYRLETLQEALDARQRLWEYGTEWLSLRRRHVADRNRSRWRADPVWCALREAKVGSPHSPLVREAVRAASEDRLVRGFLGYVTSLGARAEVANLAEALSWAGMLTERHLRETGRDFQALVEEKRGRDTATRLLRVTEGLLREVMG